MGKIIDSIKSSIQIKSIYDMFRNSKDKNTEIYHSNYYIIFVIEFFFYGFLSLYLYKTSKYFIERRESTTLSVPKGLNEKHELLLYFSKATFLRCLSIIYIILFSNKTYLDLISFINFLFHVIPSLIFLMSLYIYIGFLIEKFFELSLKRIYVLTSLKYILYFSFLLIVILILPGFIFKIYKASYFFIYSVMSINYLIIGILYLIYGIKITNSMKNLNIVKSNNPIAMRNIRKKINSRIIPTCFIICPSYLFMGIIHGLVAIDFFGIYYPNFIDLNLLDGLFFFFCELLPCFIIGYNKQKWNNFRIEELLNPQNIDDFNDRSSLKRGGDVEILEESKTLEEQMEEMFEQFEGERKNDKFTF